MLGSGKNKPVPISSVYPDSEENINRNSANDLANICNGLFKLFTLFEYLSRIV